MKQVAKIRSTMKELLTESRYNHIVNVEETAVELAKRYDVDQIKVRKAALLHDCSKQFSLEEMHRLCDCDETLAYYGHLGELIHGFSGSVYAKEKFDIIDEEILNAIRYHTIGRRGMGMLEKIIYIADAIEPNRTYRSVDVIRKLVYDDINDAILHEVDRKIEYLVERNSIIHPSSIEMRNWILSQKAK